ncbi:hypothetical protein SRS16CHR_00044 [Variovorax sp. SRS16]|uniref:hypothetical protein n=1 Tax=Variovorax sp. SRS16 TaxID=282217 RepID=UPI001318411C|nr:hypothetical protein [Variovorax sp. SRS16]VTU12805.1 hypothetical protein SRS16CHR_00044 [Variovorax sp. SRS16]
MSLPRTLSARVRSRAAVCISLGAALMLPVLAVAQSADNPPKAQRAHTLKAPPRHGKVLGGIEHGADAAGRGIDRAGDATRRGVDNTAERASRPLRRVGEAFGRKLGARGPSGPPPVGPQGNLP